MGNWSKFFSFGSLCFSPANFFFNSGLGAVNTFLGLGVSIPYVG